MARSDLQKRRVYSRKIDIEGLRVRKKGKKEEREEEEEGWGGRKIERREGFGIRLTSLGYNKGRGVYIATTPHSLFI